MATTISDTLVGSGELNGQPFGAPTSLNWSCPSGVYEKTSLGLNCHGDEFPRSPWAFAKLALGGAVTSFDIEFDCELISGFYGQFFVVFTASAGDGNGVGAGVEINRYSQPVYDFEGTVTNTSLAGDAWNLVSNTSADLGEDGSVSGVRHFKMTYSFATNKWSSWVDGVLHVNSQTAGGPFVVPVGYARLYCRGGNADNSSRIRNLVVTINGAPGPEPEPPGVFWTDFVNTREVV